MSYWDQQWDVINVDDDDSELTPLHQTPTSRDGDSRPSSRTKLLPHSAIRRPSNSKFVSTSRIVCGLLILLVCLAFLFLLLVAPLFGTLNPAHPVTGNRTGLDDDDVSGTSGNDHVMSGGMDQGGEGMHHGHHEESGDGMAHGMSDQEMKNPKTSHDPMDGSESMHHGHEENGDGMTHGMSDHKIKNHKTSDDPMKRSSAEDRNDILHGVIDHFTKDPRTTSPDVELTAAVSNGSTDPRMSGNGSMLSSEDFEELMKLEQLLKHLTVLCKCTEKPGSGDATIRFQLEECLRTCSSNNIGVLSATAAASTVSPVHAAAHTPPLVIETTQELLHSRSPPSGSSSDRLNRDVTTRFASNLNASSGDVTREIPDGDWSNDAFGFNNSAPTTGGEADLSIASNNYYSGAFDVSTNRAAVNGVRIDAGRQKSTRSATDEPIVKDGSVRGDGILRNETLSWPHM